ncbi:hypothetical protein Moror_13688 [Moniliophthora roreri MCA 2997]|uniref:Uncharacterized protein n=1 Tax=Moniliophthora roreri (strain MCA 2997) TaxID=1381753 RepID=V2WU63_MONRO|nr:hypothetical protein Moror_13688 [Moniliophthora roreri MCA 2997]
MDLALNPPIRLQTLQERSISAKTAQKVLSAFLDDFHARTNTAQGGKGGNTGVAVRLQNLRDALEEETKKA